MTVEEDALEALATLRVPQDGNKRGPHSRPMAFVCDTGDLFHEEVPDAIIWEALYVMSLRADVTWQMLTKRIERAREMLKGGQRLPANIWLGVTCENQARADERIPILLDTPATVRFVSVEPMLGAVDLSRYLRLLCGVHYCQNCGECLYCYGEDRCYESSDGKHAYPPFLSWVICGGESGPQRRPFEMAWALDLYEQCQAARVPFFFKQGSALRPGQGDELPGVGRVQEWPKEER